MILGSRQLAGKMGSFHFRKSETVKGPVKEGQGSMEMEFNWGIMDLAMLAKGHICPVVLGN